jgi:DNA primase
MKETFDIIEFLDDHNISYTQSGKNVSDGWIGISCCFCGDKSNHMGINLDKKNFSCFRCGEKGSAPKLIQALLNVRIDQAYDIIRKYQQDRPSDPKKIRQTAQQIVMPSGISKEFYDPFLKYIEKRRFPLSVIDQYDLYCGGIVGDFPYRIVIPVYYGGQIVTFVGRDITDQSDRKYKAYPIEKSVLPVKSTLYGIDDVYRKAVLVEGIFDAWRVGRGAVASFGTAMSDEQVNLLSKLQSVYIMWDADASEKAKKLAHRISSVVKHVEVITLSEGDPDNLSEEIIIQIREEVFDGT